MSTGKGKATAYNATVSTKKPKKPPQLTVVLGTTQHLARTEAQKQGAPTPRALHIGQLDQITNDDVVLCVKAKGDRSAAWAELQTLGCTVINPA